VRNPRRWLGRVRCAGTILLGQGTPPAAGDFAVGPSHVLPTLGAARWRAGLSVHDFLRCPSVQELERRGLERLAPVVERLAEAEGLHAHAESVRRRVA
jgi:histidinol dehydrogenase